MLITLIEERQHTLPKIRSNHSILELKWVQTVLKKHYELHPIADTDAYGKRGMYGQMLLICPKAERVVAFHGFSQKSIGELNLFAAGYK